MSCIKYHGPQRDASALHGHCHDVYVQAWSRLRPDKSDQPATIRGLTRSIDSAQLQQRHHPACNINSFTLLLSDRYNAPESSHQRKVCCAHSKTSIYSLCSESSLAAALYQEFGRRSLLDLFFCTLVT